MDGTGLSENELREVRGLVERIDQGNCVLVLGPRVAVRPGDETHTPLDDLVARQLLASFGHSPDSATTNLRRAADLHYREKKDPAVLQVTVAELYREAAGSTTAFHRDLA